MRNNRRSTTRQRMIRAAESLMAEHGIANVTTRDILEQAGQRNQSALQYHFGSMKGLIRMALMEHLEHIDGRRIELLRGAHIGDETAVVRAFVLPISEDVLNREDARNSVSLLCQFVHSPDQDYDEVIRLSRLPGICAAMDCFWNIMPPLHSQLRMLRYRAAFSAALTALVLWSHSETRSSAADFTDELSATVIPFLFHVPGPIGSNHLPGKAGTQNSQFTAPCSWPPLKKHAEANEKRM